MHRRGHSAVGGSNENAHENRMVRKGEKGMPAGNQPPGVLTPRRARIVNHTGSLLFFIVFILLCVGDPQCFSSCPGSDPDDCRSRH